MEDTELRSLRRTVRRDSDISSGAARLFAEVIDLHMMKQGCFAQDTTLAEWLGTTPRTIRRWRKELYSAGYLREQPDDNGRLLIPHEAKPDKNVRTKMSDRTKMSGQKCPGRTEMSGGPDKNVRDRPDKNVQHRENNITQAVGPGEGAPAPAREANADGPGGDGAPKDTYPVERAADSVDAITAAAFGEPVRGMMVKDEIRTYCERAGPKGWDCLRSACHLIEKKGWNPTAQLVKKKLTDQLEMLDESDEKQKSNGFASKAESIHQAARRGAGIDRH